MFFKKKQQVCIEIRDNVIRFVELKHTDPVVVTRYGERFISDGMIENGKLIDAAAFKSFMAECIEQWELKRKEILFVQPNEAVVVKIVKVPHEITAEELRGYLYLELGESIILPFEDPTIDFVVLSEKEDGKEVLLVATPFDLVTSYGNVFRSDGANPVAADIAPLCYYRLYMNYIQEEKIEDANEEELMILQLDINSATISLFEHHNLILMQYNQVAVENNGWSAGELVDEDIRVTWDGSAEEMLASFDNLMGDIERILHFYQFSVSNGNNIKKMIVVGENPFLENFVDEMTSRFDLPIQMIPTVIPMLNGEMVPREYQLAMGLGLKEM